MKSPQQNKSNVCLTKAVAVTPSDSTDLANTATALYIGVSGDVKVTLANDTAGTSVVLKSMPVGLYHMRVSRVWNTGTLATNIIAMR